jgi:hypothetical protein
MDNTIERLDIQASFTGGDAQSGLDKLYATLDKISNITSKVTKVTENSSRANITSKVNFASLERVAKTTAKALSKCFTATNDYVESLNLFNVAMGDATQKALEYAMTVERVMGINSGDWMNYQGSYNQIFEGYGLDPDQANQMSQQLTQLTYDLSSLWNVDTDTAFQKIQSGMSGQIKGLKVWGYNLSVASLRETALAHGIELSTAKMTESQKAILRYITLMEASSNAHGDLARTILTPANSLRILKSQFEIMQRTVGQVVSVFAVKLIPVVQVMIQWVTALAEKMAQAFGYELPEIDYTGISAGAGYADDLANGLDDSAKKAEKLKRSLLGIDEINKLSDNSDKSTATEYGGGYASDFGMDLEPLGYDFLKNIDTSGLDKIPQSIKKVIDWLEKWDDTAKGVAVTTASIFVLTNLYKFFSTATSLWDKFKALKVVGYFRDGFTLMKGLGGGFFKSFGAGLENTSAKLTKLQRGFVGLAGGIAEFTLIFGITKAITEQVKSDSASIGTIIGGITVAVAALTAGFVAFSIAFNSTGIGAIVTLVVGAIAGVAGYIAAVNEAAKEAYEASEDFQVMEGIISRSQTTIDNCTSSIDNLTSGISAIDKVSADFTSASQLVDEIYAISNNANASAYELELMETKIDILNNMGIDGLTLSIDETTGRVKESKKAVESLIESLEQEARMEAMRDMLVQAYKDQYQAQIDAANAARDYTAAEEALAKTSEALINTSAWEFSKRAELTAQQEKQTEAVYAAQEAYKTSMDTYDELKKNIDAYSQELTILKANEKGVGDNVLSGLEKVNTGLDETALGMYSKGENIAQGLRDGVSDSVKEHEYTGIWSRIGNWFKSLFGIHSPSTVFADYGEDVGAGVKIGVDRSIKKSDYTSIFERIKSAWNDFKSWWSNLSLPQLKFKMPHFTWTTQPASGWIAEVLSAINLPVALPKLNVSWYASGGFPQTGEMFIANEAGPELVGTIGNKTAVANQGQIEAGIAMGVADANEEQNRLLREQNSLLTKLLNKESVVQAYVTASDIVSGLNQKNRRDGKTTVPVGV